MPDYKPMSEAEKKRLKEAFASAAAQRAKKKLEKIKEMDKKPEAEMKPQVKRPAKRIKTRMTPTEAGGKTARALRRISPER